MGKGLCKTTMESTKPRNTAPQAATAGFPFAKPSVSILIQGALGECQMMIDEYGRLAQDKCKAEYVGRDLLPVCGLATPKKLRWLEIRFFACIKDKG